MRESDKWRESGPRGTGTPHPNPPSCPHPHPSRLSLLPLPRPPSSLLPSRKLYDQTGALDDDASPLAGQSFDQLYHFFRGLYKKVSEADLDGFEASFRGSPAEEAELLDLYTRHGGDMGAVFDWLPCSDPARDAHRFADAVEGAVRAGTLAEPVTAKFRAWKKVAVEGKPRPANPLAPRAKATKKKGGGDEAALVLAMRQAAAGRLAGVVASVEARVGGGGKGRKGGSGASTPPVEPSEAEFAAAAARLEARRAGGGGGEAKRRRA